MKTLAALLFCLVAGPGLLYTGIRSLRSGAWRTGVPALELLVDRAAGVDPPPRTRGDRAFALFQALAATIFGLFFTVCLLAVLSTFVPE